MFSNRCVIAVCNIAVVLCANAERVDEAERKLVETERGKAKAEKELAEAKRRLTETEHDLVSAKNGLANLENILMHSANQLTETKSKLTAAERRAFEAEQKLQASIASVSVGGDNTDYSSRDDKENEGSFAGCGMATDEEDMNSVAEQNRCCFSAVK